MHKPEHVVENDMHKILRDFEIKTDLWPDLVLINKKKTVFLCILLFQWTKEWK